MKIRIFYTAGAVMLLMMLAGCSRASINYQIAESIGTVGMYENNEPVETPKMRSAREQQEALEAAEASFQEQLDHAGGALCHVALQPVAESFSKADLFHLYLPEAFSAC